MTPAAARTRIAAVDALQGRPQRAGTFPAHAGMDLVLLGESPRRKAFPAHAGRGPAGTELRSSFVPVGRPGP